MLDLMGMRVLAPTIEARVHHCSGCLGWVPWLLLRCSHRLMSADTIWRLCRWSGRYSYGQSGDLAGVLALGVGVLFVPALALAAGVWSGSGKLFQVVYLLLWYVGVLQGLRWLDFVGVTIKNAVAGTPVYLGAVLALLALSARGRQQQRME